MWYNDFLNKIKVVILLSYKMANEFFKEKFGCKIIKIPLNGGFTCPNRDGKKGFGGCVFCSEKGSGDFLCSNTTPITEQFKQMKEVMSKKWKNGKYMVYFQSFTNTYAPIEKLRELYYTAISFDDVVGISIGTRPDCINSEVIELLKELNEKVYVTVELGLQTSNEKSVKYINRCYENSEFENAMKMLNDANIDVICHIIFGLPNETKEDMLNSVKYAVSNGIKGIKIQLLHILEGTALAEIYKTTPFKVLTLDEYCDLVVSAISILPDDVVVHRITGDGPKKILIEPKWSGNKKLVLNRLNKELLKLR